jgi:hypothetical protein
MNETPLVQVLRGGLTDEELAAVTAVLLVRAAATRRPAADRPESAPRWQRRERQPSYYSPRSWQTAA